MTIFPRFDASKINCQSGKNCPYSEFDLQSLENLQNVLKQKFVKKVIDVLQLGAKEFNTTSEFFCLIFNICQDHDNEIFDETKNKPYEDPYRAESSLIDFVKTDFGK